MNKFLFGLAVGYVFHDTIKELLGQDTLHKLADQLDKLSAKLEDKAEETVEKAEDFVDSPTSDQD